MLLGTFCNKQKQTVQNIEKKLKSYRNLEVMYLTSAPAWAAKGFATDATYMRAPSCGLRRLRPALHIFRRQLGPTWLQLGPMASLGPFKGNFYTSHFTLHTTLYTLITLHTRAVLRICEAKGQG